MRILQSNMHRSKTASSLIDQIMLEENADMAIISEQYLTTKSGFWLEDHTKTAAIWIPQHRTMIVKEKGTGNGFVWIKTKEITFFSCYLTPSDRMEEFTAKINSIEDKGRDMGPLVIAGDFNSKATEWGSDMTNSRGRYILDMAARLGLAIANTGDTPTFRRPGCVSTTPDITLISEGIYNRLSGWKVLEDFTGSDHDYIVFSLDEFQRNSGVRNSTGTRRWNLATLVPEILLDHIGRSMVPNDYLSDARTLVRNTMKSIREACEASMKRIASKPHRQAAYWWTDEIARLRKTCVKYRRKYTRARKNGDAIAEADALKNAKKNLKKIIARNKKLKWEELRNDLNNDPWGLGYKIVMRKIGARTPTPDFPKDTIEHIVHSLFPSHAEREEDLLPLPQQPLTLFSKKELMAAVSSLRNRKAPGPDGIPAEILKLIAESCPDVLLSMYNACLREGIFPELWKRQQLVLISKGKGDPESPSAYRPLCMLDTAGKLLEALLKPRIQTAVRNSGGLSQRQHGFRPRMSTIGAIQDVLKGAEMAQMGNHHSRRVVLLATLDVRNAFNSVRWTDIIHALESRFRCPAYIVAMIRSYLRDRELIYLTEGRRHKMKVTSGAAQGSILGPELWNISYDEILNIDMPPEAYLVGYADDIAAVIPGRDMEEVERKLNQVMIRTKAWLDSRGLNLATEKTELMIITRRHIPLSVEMRVLTKNITTQNSIKYLGLRLDSRLNFNAQLRHAAMKAAKITASLGRLMANIGGPLHSKRRLMMSATQSVLLYGCEIWADSIRNECRRRILSTAQRTAALRVSSAYRTVSEVAILVISRVIPIDLLARERKMIWDLQKNGREINHECIRMQTLQEWQGRWSRERYGRWTAILIPDVISWYRIEHGETNYYLTQLLSGHGYFQEYLHRMGKTESPRCIYGDGRIDDAQHTFFECPRWREERHVLERDLNVEAVTTENFQGIMMSSASNWTCMATFARRLLLTKKLDLHLSELAART